MLLHTAVAFAAIPFILSAAARSAPSIIRAGSTLLLAPVGSGIPKYGTADNYGIKRNFIGKVGAYAGIAVSGYLAYSEIKAKLAGNEQMYPNLANATKKQTNAPSAAGATTYVPSNTVGSYISYNGNYYQLTSYVHYATGGCSSACYGTDGDTKYFPNGSGLLIVKNGWYGPKDVWTYGGVSAYTPTYIDIPPDQIPAAIMENGDIKTNIQQDLDNFIKMNPDLVEVPQTLPADIADAERQVNHKDLKTADQSRVDALTQNRDAAQTAYNNNQTQENLDKLNQAQAELDKAKATQAKDNLQNANLTPPENPDLKEINFTPLYDLGNDLAEKFPFSLLKTIKAIADGFVTAPKAPEFSITFPAPFNHEWRFSLARWDGIAETIRFLIAATFLCYTVMTIIRRWR